MKAMPENGPALLPRYRVADLPERRIVSISAEIRAQVKTIVEDVRRGGAGTAKAYGERFGDLGAESQIVLGAEDLARAFDRLPQAQQQVLVRTRERIYGFASAHRASIQDVVVNVPGGKAGIRHRPVAAAGCYAPGGRFPLPSSVLMTCVTAKAAGVQTVWVASPRPTDATLAAAHVAGANGVLALGGAQGIAALAFGVCGQPKANVVVGPGNVWVTAAKELLAGETRIDMLAGPSELLVIADDEAAPDQIAADLLAQAEHDPEACPMLLLTDEKLLARVGEEIERQLSSLPTAAIAKRALRNGFACVVQDLDEACRIANEVGPEHLSLHARDFPRLQERLTCYGALFLGGGAAEVFGDYGVGPNHVLPTGGTAASHGALSVLDFLRVQEWLDIDPAGAPEMVSDAVQLARMEGLEGHARAALCRLPA